MTNIASCVGKIIFNELGRQNKMMTIINVL